MTAAATLHIRLLGGFQAASGDRPLPALHAPRPRALLARLLLRAGAAQSRAQLAPLFWPDSSDAQARTNLRKQIHELWRALPTPDAFVRSEGQALTWRLDAPYTLDVAEFVALAGRPGDSVAIARAVGLYRGDLLPECYDEWIAPERALLRDRFGQLLERGIALGQEEGDLPRGMRQ